MKKAILLYALLLSFIGLRAQGGFFMSLTLEINDPSLAIVQQQYFINDKMVTVDLTFDDQNLCEVVFPDGCLSGALWNTIRVKPVTPEESSDIVYFLDYTLYDSEDEIIESKTVNSQVTKSIGLDDAKCDGGRLVLNIGTLQNYHMTVNVDGDPTKFRMMFDGKTVSGLKKGSQVVEFSPANKYLFIAPKGVTQLYQVKYNGEIVDPRADSAEGSGITYNYTINNPEDNATLEIYTDYPDIYYPVEITCNLPEFVKSVTVDGKEASDWNTPGFQVKAGAYLSIVGERYDYLVNSLTYNGDALYNSFSFSKVIEGASTIVYDVAKIERDKTCVVYLDKEAELSMRTSLDSYREFESGYTLGVKFCEKDNPVTFYSSSLGTDENVNRYVFLNDELVSSVSANYDITLSQDDVVKFYFATSEPDKATVTFAYDGVDAKPSITKDYIRNITTDADAVLPGTRIEISPVADQILYVYANDNEVKATEGVFVITIDADTKVLVASTEQKEEEGPTDGIQSVISDSINADAYNLQGIKQDKASLKPGLYIIDGKKIYIRK